MFSDSRSALKERGDDILLLQIHFFLGMQDGTESRKFLFLKIVRKRLYPIIGRGMLENLRMLLIGNTC